MPEPDINPVFEILHEEEDWIAVDKSGNCPVHEGGLYKENSLVRLLEKKYGSRSYPVFRLDRETSGIVIFAKDRKKVKEIFESITYKEYIAIVKGSPQAKLIDAPIGEIKGDHINWKKAVTKDGKDARTFIEPLMQKGDKSLIKVMPLTGRQHQIRVHLQHIGHPIVGDKVYGDSDKLFKDHLDGKAIEGRQLLHMHKIVIGSLEIMSDLPQDMESFLNQE